MAHNQGNSLLARLFDRVLPTAPDFFGLDVLIADVDIAENDTALVCWANDVIANSNILTASVFGCFQFRACNGGRVPALRQRVE